ncbi:hypothetical protein [Paraburkholderia adhaesiva]|uniref:hypothetical protein n=1 Tax=Paraburkholderia adhaesiva TaxID=2883244 RepID=UPI001F393EC5|nr:hypothetical protein [Paraburkholderia adhaesiva]
MWRLHQANGGWKAEEIWRGEEGAGQLALSANGHTAWFDGASTRQATHEWFAYDVDARRLTHYAMTRSDADRGDFGSLRWELAGDQLPAVFDHNISLGDRQKNPLGGVLLSVLRPTAPPSLAHDAWPFGTAFLSARQAMMGADMEGNTLIWPVRWRDPKVFWVEDQPGIAELDAASGRVLRALALPQRFGFGAPDPHNATGVAQGAPTPLGSPEAGWIATGFELRLADDGHMPSSLYSVSNDNGSFVGMHVVNLKDGHALSALLGRSEKLAAAARSAHGRFLALGGMKPGSPHVVLWDIAQARTPVQLETSSRSELHAVAFSWNGADLWALGDRELFHWSLPDSLRDAAAKGSFPDQSH